MIRRFLVIVLVLMCCISLPVYVSAEGDLVPYSSVISDSVPSYIGWSGLQSNDWIPAAEIYGFEYDNGLGEQSLSFYLENVDTVLERSFEGVDFSLKTNTFKTFVGVDEPSMFNYLRISVPLSSVFRVYNQDQFSSLSVNFALNVFNSSELSLDMKRGSVSFGKLRRTVNDEWSGDSDYPFVTADTTLNQVVVLHPTVKSSFFVFNVSLSSLSNYFLSDETFMEIYILFDNYVTSESVEVDIGSYVDYIGYGRMLQYYPPVTAPDINDIWPDLPELPKVTMPDDHYGVSSSDAFDTVNGTSFVVLFLVPLGVACVSFFLFKIIVWK